MAGYNRIVLVGNLTREPELKYIASGKALCKVGLAVNKKFKRQDGSYSDEVLYVDCVCWEKTAENVAQYLHKGSQVLVEGRLTFSTWEAKEGGGKRSKHEVNVDQVQFLSKPQGQGATQAQEPPPGSGSQVPEDQPAPPPSGDDEVPF